MMIAIDTLKWRRDRVTGSGRRSTSFPPQTESDAAGLARPRFVLDRTSWQSSAETSDSKPGAVYPILTVDIVVHLDRNHPDNKESDS